MRKLKIGDTEYGAIESVDWDTAIEHGGFYFDRAKYLDLPKPPAIAVVDIDDALSAEELEVIGEYHQRYKDAEAEIHQKIGIE